MKFGFIFLIFTFLLISIGYTQTIEIRPKYAPRKEKHKNSSDVKGKQGTWKYFTRNRELFYEVNYENDKKNGPSIRYFTETGSPREEINYSFDEKEGDFKSYFFNGNVKSEGSFKKNKRDGQWTFYHKSTGEKSSEGQYKDGKKNSEWTFYNRKGELICKGEYNHDNKINNWQYFDSDGKEIRSIKYSSGESKNISKIPSLKKSSKPKSSTQATEKGLGTTTNTTPVAKKNDINIPEKQPKQAQQDTIKTK